MVDEEYDEFGGELVTAEPDMGVPVAVDTTPLTTDEARTLTASIHNAFEVSYVLLARAHAGKAWLALGYNSWSDYVREEFDMSRSRAYQFLDQARVIAEIEASVPEGTQVHLSEAEARDLKGVLEDLVPEIRDATEGLAPAEAEKVLEEMVETQRERLREARERAAESADEDEESEPREYDGPWDGNYSERNEAPEPVYEDLGDLDVARIRRNVNAAHEVYSALAALAGLPDDLEEVIAIIPEERTAQIDTNLSKAQAALARVAEIWAQRKDGDDYTEEDSEALDFGEY